jgi:hypothetical protein
VARQPSTGPSCAPPAVLRWMDARLVFRIGDVFSADDVMARYVVRLSIALGTCAWFHFTAPNTH